MTLIFHQLPGSWNGAVMRADILALSGAGVLFGYASVPYRGERSSLWMTGSLLTTTTLYLLVATSDIATPWMLLAAALLVGLIPLGIALFTMRSMLHPLRWMIVCLYCALAIYLLAVQLRPGSGHTSAVNGALCAIYLSCAMQVAYNYFKSTTGAFITTVGFVTWALVFVLRPLKEADVPPFTVNDGVWNLPMYVVAVGMILLMLEDQLERSRYLAQHDELTGLPNRRLFFERLAQSVERSRRSHQRCALLVVDLNRFKNVNDTLGHHVGDLLLQHVAGVFSARVRCSDTVARTGGDEFSIILENQHDADRAEQVAEQLLDQLNSPLHVAGRMVRVGASVGVALYPDDAEDMDTLRIAADLRMYSNKHMHRCDEISHEERCLTFPEMEILRKELRASQERSHA